MCLSNGRHQSCFQWSVRLPGEARASLDSTRGQGPVPPARIGESLSQRDGLWRGLSRGSWLREVLEECRPVVLGVIMHSRHSQTRRVLPRGQRQERCRAAVMNVGGVVATSAAQAETPRANAGSTAAFSFLLPYTPSSSSGDESPPLVSGRCSHRRPRIIPLDSAPAR